MYVGDGADLGRRCSCRSCSSRTTPTDEGIDSGPATALVSIIGASSVVGRLGLGALGARLGATRLMQLSFAIMAASFLIWLTAGGSYPAPRRCSPS